MKVADPPPGTVTSVLVPATVTVCVAESELFTVTVTPGFTVRVENMNCEIVIVEPPAATGGVVGGTVGVGLSAGELGIEAGGEVVVGVDVVVLEHPLITSRRPVASVGRTNVRCILMLVKRPPSPGGSTPRRFLLLMPLSRRIRPNRGAARRGSLTREFSKSKASLD